MQSEQINFTYILNTAAVNEPIAITATVNGNTVATDTITKNGRFEFLVPTDLPFGNVNLDLHIGKTNNAIVTVALVKMQWLKENSNINPSWTGREPGPGEIWHYGAPPGTYSWSAEINAAHHGTIMLEYETDGRKSFLRNYAEVSINDQRFNLRGESGPYTFRQAGKFTIPMTSPVSYWLMERLFVAI